MATNQTAPLPDPVLTDEVRPASDTSDATPSLDSQSYKDGFWRGVGVGVLGCGAAATVFGVVKKAFR